MPAALTRPSNGSRTARCESAPRSSPCPSSPDATSPRRAPTTPRSPRRPPLRHPRPRSPASHPSRRARQAGRAAQGREPASRRAAEAGRAAKPGEPPRSPSCQARRARRSEHRVEGHPRSAADDRQRPGQARAHRLEGLAGAYTATSTRAAAGRSEATRQARPGRAREDQGGHEDRGPDEGDVGGPGSAATGRAYPVTPEAGLVPTFKQLSLRLNVWRRPAS